MKRTLTYMAIVSLTISLLIGLFWKHNRDIDSIKTSYVKDQALEIDRVATKVETAFNDFYQGIRTMSLLPGVRKIDRYGKNFNEDSRMAMQQIYNNTYQNVTLSEVYILPRTLNPDRIDTKTGKPEEPILTFDEFIVSRDRGEGAKADEKEKLEEVEIFEYRLMKNQLESLGQLHPTNKSFKGLDVPVISGAEIVTCDNSEFTTEDLRNKDEQKRKGIALTVPVYNQNGDFNGAVSGIVRSEILKKLIPTHNYGLLNPNYGWKLMTEPSLPLQKATGLVVSDSLASQFMIDETRLLQIKDLSPWYLRIVKDGKEFSKLNEVRQANVIFQGGIAIIILIGVSLFYGAWTAFTTQDKLERRVTEKTSELAGRNNQMATILNNAEEGFITVNLDGTMESERSAAVVRWFGTSEPSTKLWDFILKGASVSPFLFKMGWEQMVEDIFPFEVSAGQMPKIFERDGVSLDISFSEIKDAEGKLSKILVMITDVSELLEANRKQSHQKEMLDIFQHFSSDKHGFLQFFADAQSLIERIQSRRAKDNSEVDFREVHTLKGNTSQFGLRSVAEVCHKMETLLSDEGRSLTDDERKSLQIAWQEATINLKHFIEVADQKEVTLSESEFKDFLQTLKMAKVDDGIVKSFADLAKEPTLIPLRRLGDQVQSLSERLGKGPVNVSLNDHGMRLDTERFNQVWSNATHLVRNTVDHGFETPEERELTGKGLLSLVLESYRSEAGLVISFKDDGRGINWEKIQQLAEKRGLPHTTRSDLENALFADGISTSEEVSATSGRGVGMAALKSAVEALGGRIEIESERGVGTTFRLCFKGV